MKLIISKQTQGVLTSLIT